MRKSRGAGITLGVLPLAEVVLLAGIQGLSEALPVSCSGHEAAAKIWLEPGSAGAALSSAQNMATGAALLLGARRLFSGALSEGLRAVARPSLLRSSRGAYNAAVLVIAFATSLLSRGVFAPFVELWRDAPIAVGFGLLLTGVLVGTTSLLRKGGREGPTLALAILLGLGHGTGILPGGSNVGMALVLLLWMGTKPEQALDLALSLSGMTLLASFVWELGHGLGGSSAGIGSIGLGLLTAFLGALVAIEMTRALLEKQRLALLSFWIIPLGFAMIVYGRLLVN